MLDPETTAIITGAAGNLVAYMISGQINAARSWVKRIFRGATEEEKTASLHAIENDSVALTRREVSEADATSRWTAFLTAHLVEHPEILTDIRSVANSVGATVDTTNIGKQGNYGSGVFIGRDNHGNIEQFGSSWCQ